MIREHFKDGNAIKKQLAINDRKLTLYDHKLLVIRLRTDKKITI
jgi:hypothetical protein